MSDRSMGTSSSEKAERATSTQAPEQVLSRLIARLEQASGPSLELDAAIKVAANVRPLWAREAEEPLIQKGKDVTLGKGGTHFVVEPFTTSIDAALTLVPEGMRLLQVKFLESALTYSVVVGNLERLSDFQYGEALHDNLTIALCIAALKARASALPVRTEERTPSQARE